MVSVGDLRQVAMQLEARVLRRVGGIVRRAVLSTIDDSPGLARAQVTVTADQVADDVEVLTPHGFTSRPNVGAEALVLQVGGNPSHQVAVVFDRRSRKTGLAAGEAALYVGTAGQVIHLKADGSITITPAPGKKVTIGAGSAAALAFNGEIKDILGDLNTALAGVQTAWAGVAAAVYAVDGPILKAAWVAALASLTSAIAKTAALVGTIEVEGA